MMATVTSYDEEMRSPLDREGWEHREVYAEFGVAIYFCQVVEVALVSYLAFLTRAATGKEMPAEEVDDLFEVLFRKTLGTNIRAVKKLIGEQGGDWNLANQMASVLTRRNELAHHWMRTRILRFGTSEGRLGMIAELQKAREDLELADKVLTEHMERMLTKAGMPADWAAKEYARLTALSESGQEDPDAPSYWTPPQAI
jgi:hypothetical protein